MILMHIQEMLSHFLSREMSVMQRNSIGSKHGWFCLNWKTLAVMLEFSDGRPEPYWKAKDDKKTKPIKQKSTAFKMLLILIIHLDVLCEGDRLSYPLSIIS